MKCKICNNNLFAKPIIKYKNFPKQAQYLPNSPNDKGIKLNVYQCSFCSLVQLVCKPVSYYKEIITTATFSKDTQKFRKKQLTNIVKKYHLQNKSIIDIGGSVNEEICLNSGFKSYEKTNTGEIENIDNYFNNEVDNFICCNYLEHYPYPNYFLEDIKKITSKEMIGILEVPNFDMILKDNMFSEIIPDHLFYFTKDTFKFALKYNGFEIMECDNIKNNYIISAIIRKTRWRGETDIRFKIKMRKIEKSIREKLKNYNKIAIYGAGHQSFALLSQLNWNKKEITYVVDDAKFKQGKFTPATNIPIVSIDEFSKNPVNVVVVIGGSYSDEIVKKLVNIISNNQKIFIMREDGLSEIFIEDKTYMEFLNNGYVQVRSK